MKKDNSEKTLGNHLIYDGKIIRLYCDDVLLPNGKEGKREYVMHRGGAAILPIDRNGMVYLVRQYRYPYHEELLEIPAGKLENAEKPEETALRELQEETGLCAEKVELMGIMYPTPGYTNEHLYIYSATAFTMGERHLDADEFVNTVVLPFDEVYKMVMDNRIKDGKTCYAILKYMQLNR